MTMHEFSRFLEAAGEDDSLFEALARIRRSEPGELGLDSDQLPSDGRGWSQSWSGLPGPDDPALGVNR